ncbi:Carnitine O-acetyltransferase mitochondrial [Cladochytrium tenue]|nr:Carnitine O-acetyltransferase mitochondrial [Cladochytrium tenue]
MPPARSDAGASRPTLFQFQASLPKLPVPSLQETCALYLSSVRPHLSDADYARTEAAVAEFQRPGGAGEALQRRLLDRAAASPSSWLIDWWNSVAYMAYRDPVVVYVNYFFAFIDDRRLRGNAARRAAELIKGSFAFRDLVVTEKLEPESARSGPLCSHQYRFLFNSTRIPELPEDVTRTSDPSQNSHVIVIRKNKFFKLDTVVDGAALSAAELESQLRKIIAAAGDTPDVAIGALTTENRDSWAKTRKTLLAASPVNKKSLDAIETGAFVLCLDDTAPVTKEEVSVACWVGDGKNRFFDKSFQFIVFENGKAGFNGEHSMMDATPTSRLSEWVLQNLAKGTVELGPESVRAGLSEPVQLRFEVTPEVRSAVAAAEKQFGELVAAHDLRVVTFEGFGKNLIKKLQVSPDAFAQLAIQLAYYKMYGRCVPTYESAQTRKYAYGRTETCRSVTTDTVKWVKAMEDSSLSVREELAGIAGDQGGVRDMLVLEEKGALGRAAATSQTRYMARAVDGRGVDRHLLGLRMLIKPDEPKPSLFADPAYADTCYWRLSTSQITSEYYSGYGWGEVVPEGYGIAYSVKEQAFHFNLVSRHLQNERLREYFHEALWDMKAAFERAVPAPTAAPKAKL